jgi:hypothetical protein
LQAAVDGGLFEESHHLDLKKAPNSKGDNKELARDLASFAVDGGTLIIGVQENKKAAPSNSPPAAERTAGEGRIRGTDHPRPAVDRHH